MVDHSQAHADQQETVSPAKKSKELPKLKWEMTQQSEKQLFTVKLSCEKPPAVNGFQDCGLFVEHKGVAVSDGAISIDGGMKAHGHGLPTTPVASAVAQAGQYKIEGLTFSMPGEWLLGFKIVAKQGTDQAIFKFSI